MDEELEEAPKPSKLPLIIASVVCLLLGAGGGYGAAQFLGGDEGGDAVASAEEDPDAEAEPATTMDLGEFTINLRNTAGGRMLQMSVAVLVSESAVEPFAEKQSQLKDAINIMSRDYTVADLDGQDNTMHYRDELLTRLNGVMGDEVIRAVYLTSFVVQ